MGIAHDELCPKQGAKREAHPTYSTARNLHPFFFPNEPTLLVCCSYPTKHQTPKPTKYSYGMAVLFRVAHLAPPSVVRIRQEFSLQSCYQVRLTMRIPPPPSSSWRR